MSHAIRRLAGAVLVLGLLWAAPLPTAAQQHFPATEDLELMLRYMVEDGETPGVALAVLEPDGTTRTATYGVGPDGEPVTAGTSFPIGETTMTFTATLLADMVARGEVSLDDAVAAYMPEDVTVPALSGYEITLRHLAMHRAGLPAEPPASYDAFTLADMYRFLEDYRLDWVPGRSHEISTLGYGLLGHALAGAAGIPFTELLRARVLEPLDMTGTVYGADVGSALQGGTGLRSTAADMATFLAANAGPTESTLQDAMRTSHEVRTPFDPEGEGYGFSWRTYAVGRQPLLVTHGGRTPESSALITFDPERAIGTVVLAGSPDFNDWAARDLLYFAPPQRETVDVDPNVLRQYVGAYGSRGGRYRASPNRGVIFIRLEDDGFLTYQPSGRIRTPLFPVSDSAFFMLRAPLTVTFEQLGNRMQMTAVTDQRGPASGRQVWTSWRVDTETPRPDVTADNAPPWAGWSTGTRLLVGLIGLVAAVLILRPLWPRRATAR